MVAAVSIVSKALKVKTKKILSSQQINFRPAKRKPFKGLMRICKSVCVRI